MRSAGWAIPIHGGNAELPTLDSIQVGVSDGFEPDRAVSNGTLMAETRKNDSSHVSNQTKRSISDGRAPTQGATKVTFFARFFHGKVAIVTIGGVWLSSSLFLLFRLVASAIAVRRMLRLARPCEDATLLNALSNGSQRVGLTTTPRLLVSDQISAPMVLAYFQPTLLIPTLTTKQHGEKQFTTTISHELAHIRRRDGWVRLWAQLVTVVLPLQPLVWWMRKSFFEACEEACDDWAVATGSDPVDLASVLTAWSDGFRDRRELVLAVGMSGTRSRIRRLLAMSDTPSAKLSVRWRFCATTVAILIFAGLGFAQPLGQVDPAETQARTNDEPDRTPEHQQQQPNGPSAKETNESSEAISITGTCVDENDEPVPQARVRLFRFGPDGSHPTKMKQTELQGSHCDSKGRFAFKQITRSHKFDSWIVIAQHPGNATTCDYIAAEALGDQTVELKLHPAATLKGRVVNEDGNSVPGALVSAGGPLPNPVSGICASISDAEGYYEISDLRPFSLADQKLRPTGDGAYYMISQRSGWVQHHDYARDKFPYSKIPGTANVTVRRPATGDRRRPSRFEGIWLASNRCVG
ncbi:M56 family metallopeptidase [Planctomycetota bacterium]